MMKSNKNKFSKVFLTRHASGDVVKATPPLRKHSVETAKFPILAFTRSVDPQRKLEYSHEPRALYSPQEIPSHATDPNALFSAAGKEKRCILARFWHHKAESQAVLQFKQRSIESQSQIELYAKNEWATTLPNAMKMKRGYAKVKEGGYSFIRRIRGDNYCALRSVMFQILTASDTQKSILSLYSLDSALARLDDLRRDYKDLLAEWKFGTNAFLREGNGVMHSLQECVRTFFEIVKKLNAYQSSQEKRDLLVEEMNKEENNYFATDAKLVECVKFFMFSQAERLYKKQVSGKDVPLWFTLLTLRGNSSSLEEYFREQLNKVGDSLGLEQVEMCLLSSSINARIKVFRLSSIDKDDFETLYPSEGTAEFGQEVTLCAEDDRHYNVVYKP